VLEDAATSLPAGCSAGVCEDDDDLRGVVRGALERDGFTVRATASGAEAVRSFAAEPPDVIVLDIGLPDSDGRDVCQALRARGVDAPVLFLTARTTVPDRLSGFHAGGDDYLAKPFALAELLVRVRALARRHRLARATEPEGGVVLDPALHAAIYGDEEIPLTPTEFRLLGSLATHRDTVVRRHALVAAAWPDGAIVHDNTLDAYIARIRRKLRSGGAPSTIDTVRGVGYRLR
jgi:two-component system response regulator MprA